MKWREPKVKCALKAIKPITRSEADGEACAASTFEHSQVAHCMRNQLPIPNHSAIDNVIDPVLVEPLASIWDIVWPAFMPGGPTSDPAAAINLFRPWLQPTCADADRRRGCTDAVPTLSPQQMYYMFYNVALDLDILGRQEQGDCAFGLVKSVRRSLGGPNSFEDTIIGEGTHNAVRAGKDELLTLGERIKSGARSACV